MTSVARRQRGSAVAELFAEHAQGLTDLAQAAGSSAPAAPIADAFADLFEQWRDISEPVVYLRRRAVLSAAPVNYDGAVGWLRANTNLDVDGIADSVGLSPAQVTVIDAQP